VPRPDLARAQRKYSDRDRQIIAILAKYLSDFAENSRKSNSLQEERIRLSDQDADRLIDLLSALVADKRFQEKAAFVEAVSAGVRDTSGRWKRIYASRSSTLGESIRRQDIDAEWNKFINSFAQMPFQDFISLEREILASFDISPSVCEYIMNIIYLSRESVDMPVVRKSIVHRNTLLNLFNAEIKRLHDSIGQPSFAGILAKTNFSALSIIVMNTAVLFVSRDLSVAGELSTLSGATFALKKDK
jgi:hypothetical protein